MGAALDTELTSLLAYYGETPGGEGGAEAPKPEDLFALVLSFSAALQVRCSRCVADPVC